MGTRLLGAIAAVFLICSAVARGQAAPVAGSHDPVLVRSCRLANIRTFLSGMSQGAGNYPGGGEFACRRVGTGSSAMVLVYASGPASCGSGGCTLLVLAPNRYLGYIVLGRILIVRLPIRVLKSKSHGFHDLVAFVEGGGIIPGYNARFSYNGKSYPISGPSGTELPAGSPLGTIVISMTTPVEVM